MSTPNMTLWGWAGIVVYESLYLGYVHHGGSKSFSCLECGDPDGDRRGLPSPHSPITVNIWLGVDSIKIISIKYICQI
jgi:hypothetical protein